MRAFLIATLLIAACGDDVASVDLAAQQHDLSVGDLASSGCSKINDLIAQACPMGQKCTVITDATSPAIVMYQCVPVSGSKMEGETCTPPASDAGMTGADDCALGLVCTVRPQGSICHKVCAKDADCGSQFCTQWGYCDFSCTFKGTDCPSGYSCTGNEIAYDGTPHLLCAPYGTTPIGTACTQSTDCAANSVCLGTPKQCRDICQTPGTLCASGGTCTMTPGPNAVSFCQ